MLDAALWPTSLSSFRHSDQQADLILPVQAQTPQQRRANAKFAKDQEARRGKSSEELKKKSKVVQKSPISPIWLGMH